MAFSPRIFWPAACAIIAFGLWLRADVFRHEFSLDDYTQLAILEHRYPVPRSPLDLYTFSNGAREDVQALAQHGFYPWFVHPALRLSMLRPLSSALMALDHAMFGHAALAYHLHSALWWCALLALLAYGLRAWFGPGAALFALALFTVDESHSVALGWIANRNALISITFALLALFAYQRFREHARARDAWIAGLWYCLALSAGEYALCVAAFAFAYELLEASGPWRQRARCLSLWVAPSFAFLLARSLGGYGAYGSDMYLDPTRDLGFFLRHGLVRLPVLLGDVVWGLPSEWWTFGLYGWTQKLVALGFPQRLMATDPARTLQAGLGAAAGLLVGALAFAAVRGSRSSSERRRVVWLAAGSGMSFLPLLAGFPTTRALLAPMIGYAVLLATLCSQALRRGPQGFWARLAQGSAVLLCAAQFVIGSREARAAAHDLSGDANLVRDIALSAEVNAARISGQRAVLLNAAHPGVPIYFGLIRGQYGRPAPLSTWTLSPGFHPYFLTRTSDTQLEVEVIGGTLLTGLFERVFRTHEAKPVQGQRFVLDGLTITALRVENGGIAHFRADFDRSLEDPTWCFLFASATGLSPIELPPPGHRIRIPAPRFPTALVRHQD